MANQQMQGPGQQMPMMQGPGHQMPMMPGPGQQIPMMAQVMPYNQGQPPIQPPIVFSYRSRAAHLASNVMFPAQPGAGPGSNC